MEIVKRITEKTKFSDISTILAVFPEMLTELKEKIKENLPLETFDYFSMTIREFLELQESKMPSKIEKMLKNKKLTVFEYVKIINTFESGSEQLTKIIEATTVEQTKDEKNASTGLLNLSPEESILDFLKDYFNLHSYEEAQNLTLYEFVIARKHFFNKVTFEKNLSEIQMSRINTNSVK